MSNEKQPQDLSINDLLNLIKTANKKLEHETYLPSIDKEVHLKPLNTTHTKNIAKTAVERTFSQNQFALVMYHILKDVVDPSISLSHINTLDKTILILDLCARNNKPILNVTLQSENLFQDAKGESYYKQKEVPVNLPEHLASLRSKKLLFDDVKVDIDSYTLFLNFPSIEEEYQFENYLYNNKIKNIDENDPTVVKSLFSSMFINTIAQYIKAIEIDGKTVDLTSKKVLDRIAIVETVLRTATIMDAIDASFGKQMTDILTLNQEIDGEKYIGRIQISPSLFLS